MTAPASATAVRAATYNDLVVRQFTVMTIVWGIVGMLVGVVIAAHLIWPVLNLGPWLSYGRLRPLHTNAVVFAFGGSAHEERSWSIRERVAGSLESLTLRARSPDGPGT